MSTRSISALSAKIDSQGRLAQLFFTATVTNVQGFSVDEKVSAYDDFRMPTGDLVMTQQVELPPVGTLLTLDIAEFAQETADELLVIADEVAWRRNVFPHLDSLAGIQMTPVYVPPVIVPVVLTDGDKKKLWMGQIDNNVAVVLGKFTRFQIEYEGREKAANEYKAAGYTGDPTTWITRYADNVGLDYRVTTDLILSQAVQLRGAVQALGNLRMDKYKVEKAATIEDAEAVFNAVIAGIKQVEDSLP